MTHDDFDTLITSFLEACMGTKKTKGADYAESDDRLANFKQNADALGLTPFQVWAVYCSKHTDSIYKAIRRNPSHPRKSGEHISENIKDVIVYNLLLLGLITELEDDAKQE
jgi:ketosteroid isomerase-like protein